ncbi:MAG TPA: hypothetical protein IAA61_09185 [Candidatus Ornithomonoglobus merdipullorum]|uniref:Uncharacterized protein n=1 Tax=Candidatus Ornithomonoglobus merdipullorum TaxID=2840895 RepID=A0A9D1MD79_9FIRM|nr:hypothetical protein [Candidatus Ornithomonoglobus merdipullorum]
MCKKEDENKDVQEIELDDLEQVTGGGAFDNVPRVPQNPIDDSLREKI